MRLSDLARHESDDLADFHLQADVGRCREREDLGLEVLVVEGDPLAGLLVAGFVDIAIQHPHIGAVSQGDHVAGIDENRRDVDRLAVQLEVAVHNPLPSLQPGDREARTADHIVQTALAGQEQQLASVPFAALGFRKVAAKLTLAQAVIVLDLLLLEVASVFDLLVDFKFAIYQFLIFTF